MKSLRQSMLFRWLRRLKWAVVDAWSVVDRRFAPSHKGVEEHGLSGHQVYPGGRNFSMEFLTEPKGVFPKLINKETTRVTSIGSCFAVEVQRYLKDSGFRFISTEKSWAGSAEWGRVYTTKNLLEIIQYTFHRPPSGIRLYHTAQKIYDPYREYISFDTDEEASRAIREHDQRSCTALTSCDVMIVTSGQNEAWVDKNNGVVWARKPPSDVFKKLGHDRFDIKRFSIAENLEYLDKSLKLLWEHNPDVKIIFTVSPVPSSAVFDDANVGIRSFENKAVILLAIKEIVSRYPGRVFYFPSFEMVMLTRNGNLQLDNRHVRPRVVEEIMTCFSNLFVDDLPKGQTEDLKQADQEMIGKQV